MALRWEQDIRTLRPLKLVADAPNAPYAAAAVGRRLHAVVRRDGSQRSEELIVFGVGTDPEPDDGLAIDNGKRAVSQANAGRVDGLNRVDLLEAEAQMLRVVLEAAVSFTGPAFRTSPESAWLSWRSKGIGKVPA